VWTSLCTTFTQTNHELDRLEAFLKSCKGGKAMSLEALVGFFAALIARPETVTPSEYYIHKQNW
jgi:yecA family protein